MRLRYSPRAAQDILEIGAYIHDRDPRAAARVLGEIRRQATMLADHPQAGRRVGQGLRRLAVPRLPYVIVYRADEAADEVAVLTIRHTARRPIT